MDANNISPAKPNPRGKVSCQFFYYEFLINITELQSVIHITL